MQPKVREILLSFKADIISSLSPGSLQELLNKLSVHLLDEDRQKVECDSVQRGHSWAADSLLDRVKYCDDAAFTILLQHLEENKSTERLYRRIIEECRNKCIDFGKPTSKRSGNIKNDAKSFLKAVNPILARGLSEGEFKSMLRHLEADLQEQDVQKIKRDLNNLGHYNAVTVMINCLLFARKKTVKKFIKYLSENKEELFEEIEGKLNEYGLQNLLNSKKRDKLSESSGEKDAKIPVPETSGPDISNHLDLLGITEDSNTSMKIENYAMSNEPCGICLIINNEDFSQARKGDGKKYGDREGSSVDEENLYKLFSWLNFVVRKQKNLKALEMYKILQELSKDDHSRYDCLVVCILTHGLAKCNKDEILGVDGKSFPVDKITSLFNGNECSSLNGKPKLFFLQCCRGKWEDSGGAIEHDGPDSNCDDCATIAQTSDLFIGYSTPPGFKSWRHTTEGSWYIATLCKVFSELAWNHDLVTMSVKVNDLVSEYKTDNDQYQIPNPTMTLRKKLFFKPKKSCLK